jgi:threonine/homoserine/homoserine lactone efflux protein
MAATNVITGFLTGLPALLAVGPIALLLIEQGLDRGLRTGFPAALGVAAGDTAFAVLAAVAGTALSAVLSAYAPWLRAIAVAVLVIVAVRLLVEARRPRQAVGPEAAGPAPAAGTLATVRGHRLAGGFLGLTVVNPLTIVVYAGIVMSGGSGVGTMGWVLGMGLASLAVHSGFVGLGHVLGATLSDRAVVGVRYGAVGLLAVLAVHLLLA